MTPFGPFFDLRSPHFGPPHQQLYAEVLEMVSWGDANGLEFVELAEHHCSPDGYLPAPFLFATAVAARTTNMRIQIGVVLLPLHDPVTVAENLAVADLISNGRMEVVLGAGYHAAEFRMFDRRLEDRGRLLDEGIEIILRALSGERFSAYGRDIFVRPLPVQDPHDALLVGGGVPAAVHRAVRFGLGMAPMSIEIADLYVAECAKAGHKPGKLYRPSGGGWTVITEDPDKTWSQLAPHVMHVIESYVEFAKGTTSSSPFETLKTLDAVKQTGIVQVMTPDEVVAHAERVGAQGGKIALTPVLGGLDPKIGWESLELYVNNVRPRLGELPAAWSPGEVE